MFQAEEIRPDIYWVGALDWNERSFHGYTTEEGITYNAYLIIDEKITLIDTVKAPFKHELLERIASVIDPQKIDIVVTNHVEMDHSGSLPAIVKACPRAQHYCSSRAASELKSHYGDIASFKAVKTGDVISLGKRSLTFVETPMVHWPDNMVTYCPEEKILFSNDAFGQHYASSSRLDVDADMCEVYKQARKYYANIVQPYAAQAAAALKTVQGLDVQMIAPSHGIIWTEHIPDILSLYERWVSNKRVKKAAIIYDSMWNSTAKIGKAICEAFVSQEIEARYFDVKENHESDIIAWALDADYICVGSPTLNSRLMPNVAKFLTYFLGLSPKNEGRYAVAFGSYGWAPLGPKMVHEQLAGSGFNMLCDPIAHNWVPTTDTLSNIQKTLAERIATTLS